MHIQKQQYNRRFLWWYNAISDLMISSPELKMREIADRLKRHPNTISLIMGSDMFKEFHAQRLAEWRRRHDTLLLNKLTQVGEKALDNLLSQLETKKDKVPIGMVHEIATGALDRLGYAPKTSPQITIDQRDQSQKVVIQGITASDLEEARNAMRIAQERSRGSSFALEMLPPLSQGVDGSEEADYVLEPSED